MKPERIAFSEIKITTREFEQILPQICDAKISKYPQRWTPDNPLLGTCLPVALVSQRFFGGQLLRASLKPFPEFRYMFWHWINLLPNGKRKDFTEPQFKNKYPEEMVFIEQQASLVTRIPDVLYRSELLYKRLLKHI